MKKLELLVFGDLNGCDCAAERAINLAKDRCCRAVFLGNYIGRGGNSLLTLQLLLQASKENPNWVFIRGIQDQMFLDLEEKHQRVGTEIPEKHANAASNHFKYIINKFRMLSHVNKYQLFDFLNLTKPVHEVPNLIFVNSPIRNDGFQLIHKSNEELISNYQMEPPWLGNPFIHGRILTTEPKLNYKGFNINTGCGYGGYLTGMHIFNTLTTNFANQADYQLFSISEKGRLSPLFL